jgi:hypothetical protein
MPSLGNYRVDVAPPSIRPSMTPADVLAAVERSDERSYAHEPNARVITRFGLFSGFEAHSVGGALGGALGPTRSVVRRPAWLVVVSGVLMSPNQGVGLPGQTLLPQMPAPGWTLFVVYDDSGQPQGVVTQQGQDPHIT